MANKADNIWKEMLTIMNRNKEKKMGFYSACHYLKKKKS